MPLIKSSLVALQWTNSCDSAVDAACLKCVAPTAIYAPIFMISKWLTQTLNYRLASHHIFLIAHLFVQYCVTPAASQKCICKIWEIWKLPSCHCTQKQPGAIVWKQWEKLLHGANREICWWLPSRWQATLGLFVIEPIEFKLLSNCPHVCCCITPLLPSLGNMLVCLVKQLLTLSNCSL